MAADDPAVARRRLKAEMRALREAADLTREKAAAQLDWSLSKMVRIESGDQGVSVTDLRALLTLYEVADKGTFDRLTKLARSSRKHAWWSGYRDLVSKPYGQLLGYESSASYVRACHPLLIPGLLHTEDYGYELRRVRMPEGDARRLADLLTQRQERLFEQPIVPETNFIFGEEALHRLIGGPVVMRHQLRKLLAFGELPTVSIQVIPLSAGAHVGLIGQFTLLGLRDSGDDLLFIEAASGDIANRDDQDLLDTFTRNFESLQVLALSAEETTKVVEQKVDDLSSMA